MKEENTQCLIATATLNEVDTLGELVRQIRAAAPHGSLLIVDDNSSDGTQELISELQANDSRIHLISRPRKLGVGSAHLIAMRYALEHNYQQLVTMDADFSHDPRDIPRLLEELNQNDFVIGSRFCEGGSCEYPLSRQVLSRTANSMARILLGLPLQETTTSFRAFNRGLLEKLTRYNITPSGYSFFFQMTYIASRLSDRLGEIPIRFADRRGGTSKIKKRDILFALGNLLRLTYNRLLGREPERRIERSFDPCLNCGHSYFQEIYPERRDGGLEVNISCTGTVHRSHGPIAKCLTCGLTQTNPILPELETLYEDVEDRTYVENIPAREITFRENWKNVASEVPANGKLLDVGCYCGVWLDQARNFGFDVVGVEPSRWATDFAREMYKLDVTQGTVEDLPPGLNNFDIVTSWDVLEHVPNPNEFLRGIYDRLKPGGVFIFSTVMIDTWFPKLMGERWPWYVDMHLTYFTDKTLTTLLEDSGFNVTNKQRYTHTVKATYLLEKLNKLGIPSFITNPLRRIPWLQQRSVPVSLGDICLWTCTKPELEAKEKRRRAA